MTSQGSSSTAFIACISPSSAATNIIDLAFRKYLDIVASQEFLLNSELSYEPLRVHSPEFTKERNQQLTKVLSLVVKKQVTCDDLLVELCRLRRNLTDPSLFEPAVGWMCKVLEVGSLNNVTNNINTIATWCLDPATLSTEKLTTILRYASLMRGILIEPLPLVVMNLTKTVPDVGSLERFCKRIVSVVTAQARLLKALKPLVFSQAPPVGQHTEEEQTEHSRLLTSIIKEVSISTRGLFDVVLGPMLTNIVENIVQYKSLHFGWDSLWKSFPTMLDFFTSLCDLPQTANIKLEPSEMPENTIKNILKGIKFALEAGTSLVDDFLFPSTLPPTFYAQLADGSKHLISYSLEAKELYLINYIGNWWNLLCALKPWKGSNGPQVAEALEQPLKELLTTALEAAAKCGIVVQGKKREIDLSEVVDETEAPDDAQMAMKTHLAVLMLGLSFTSMHVAHELDRPASQDVYNAYLLGVELSIDVLSATANKDTDQYKLYMSHAMYSINWVESKRFKTACSLFDLTFEQQCNFMEATYRLAAVSVSVEIMNENGVKTILSNQFTFASFMLAFFTDPTHAGQLFKTTQFPKNDIDAKAAATALYHLCCTAVKMARFYGPSVSKPKSTKLLIAVNSSLEVFDSCMMHSRQFSIHQACCLIDHFIKQRVSVGPAADLLVESINRIWDGLKVTYSDLGVHPFNVISGSCQGYFSQPPEARAARQGIIMPNDVCDLIDAIVNYFDSFNCEAYPLKRAVGGYLDAERPLRVKTLSFWNDNLGVCFISVMILNSNLLMKITQESNDDVPTDESQVQQYLERTADTLLELQRDKFAAAQKVCCNPQCASLIGFSGCRQTVHLCSKCKKVRYCSVECQKLDWKNGHKEVCKKA